MLEQKEFKLNNFRQCIDEAISTITEYWVDNLSTDLRLEEIEIFVNEIVDQLTNYDEDDFNEEIINDIKATPLHSCEYDLETDNIPERAYSGLIIIVKDSIKNTTLIIDGNHRFNTFQKHCPNQKVLTYTIYGSLP